MGILPEHAPLISTLAFGELRIKKGNTEESILVYGGFIEVANNKVLVLADTAERADEVDLARADEARKRRNRRSRGGGKPWSWRMRKLRCAAPTCGSRWGRSRAAAVGRAAAGTDPVRSTRVRN